MSDSVKQTQKAGDHSENVQGQHVEIHHHGLTLSDARQLFLDLFEANFYRLQSVARRTAEERAAELTEKYLDQLLKRSPSALDSSADPGMQAAILTAQWEYARSGDKDLSALLVDLLVCRAAEPKRSLRQIVLNESLAVAAKLTAEHYDLLSLMFIVKYQEVHPIRNLDLAPLKEYLQCRVLPFASCIPSSADSAYAHLEWTGCAIVGINGTPGIEGVLLSVYPGLFCKGFLPEAFVPIADPTPLLNLA
jgi:hypothetical protein